METTETKTKQKPSFDTDPIGFDNRINYSMLYHGYVTNLNQIHITHGLRDAITYFNAMVVPAFGGVFDRTFLKNCVEINENISDPNERYMLHRVELGRLMTRCGIAPKPDIRLRYKAMWDVPKDLNDLSFDGSKRVNTENNGGDD